MLSGILRFHREAGELLDAPASLTLGRYLERKPYPQPFVERYLLPMAAAIWSTEVDQILDFPVRTLASFLDNHGMLQVENRPRWKVVRGGSHAYVDALTAPFREYIYTRTPVLAVERFTDGVALKLDDGERARFDAVVFATHSDQALRILGDGATEAEREVLGAIPYTENDVVLHTDRNLLPRRRRAWASWNYHLDPSTGPLDGGTGGGSPGTQVTYWMNRLQNLEADDEFCVTLNRTEAIDPERILHRQTLAHPLFVAGSEQAKARWSEISRGRTHFCGAYWGFGFHEDGVRSGLRVSEALGAEPWGMLTAGIDGHHRARLLASEHRTPIGVPGSESVGAEALEEVAA
jgi:predicted NAD/FAD-binding protein